MFERFARAPVLAALVVAVAWSGCIGGDGGGAKGDAAVPGDPVPTPGNLTTDKVVSAPLRLVGLPLGNGELHRTFRTSSPLGLPVLESKHTRFWMNVTELWPTDDLKYQVWVVDEDANKSLRSETFTVSSEGYRENYVFEFVEHHPTYNKAVVTLEPHADEVMGLPILVGTFDSGQARTLAFNGAGMFQDIVSQGSLQAGRGMYTVAFAATGVPPLAGLEYHVWLELGGNSTDLGLLELDANETDSWSFAASDLTLLPGRAFLDNAKFAVTVEPSGNKDEKSSGAVVLRAVVTG